jgi:hypothetical protein
MIEVSTVDVKHVSRTVIFRAFNDISMICQVDVNRIRQDDLFVERVLIGRRGASRCSNCKQRKCKQPCILNAGTSARLGILTSGQHQSSSIPPRLHQRLLLPK